MSNHRATRGARLKSRKQLNGQRQQIAARAKALSRKSSKSDAHRFAVAPMGDGRYD
jgi:hypothetical protein